ncbi:hypothetical protein ASD88_00630 [Pelomonas sp. Root662]|nr:hypothetical protein ASC81_00630 [Pelomonas sp. Root405]KRA77427.1 hypothetical protein ASD88_00630 [Pelomonas sp. Root662]
MFCNSMNDGRSAARVAGSRFAVAIGTTLVFSAALLPALAQAQTAAKASAADPTDSQASVPAVRYAGALARYRALQEAPPASWQQVNEKANQAGGWRAYARERAATDDSPAAPAAAASSAKGHEGHAPR